MSVYILYKFLLYPIGATNLHPPLFASGLETGNGRVMKENLKMLNDSYSIFDLEISFMKSIFINYIIKLVSFA
jgi:hypothetical protein